MCKPFYQLFFYTFQYIFNIFLNLIQIQYIFHLKLSSGQIIYYVYIFFQLHTTIKCIFPIFLLLVYHLINNIVNSISEIHHI